MEFSSLYDMIRYIQYGTNFHIGVVFLGDNGNDKCHLPHEHEIHSSAMCQMFKKILHFYLASENVVKKWTQRYRGWDQVLNQLIVLYPERLTP